RGFANRFILRHSSRAAGMEMTVVGSVREVQRMSGKIGLAVAGIGLGLIALTAAACETVSGRLAPSTSTTTLMAGWERKFTLDWTVEPGPNNARRIRGQGSSSPKEARMGSLTGSELLARSLTSQGMDTLFFLMGGPMLETESACLKLGVRAIDTRHEQAAAMMAHAYSRTTRRPGV